MLNKVQETQRVIVIRTHEKRQTIHTLLPPWWKDLRLRVSVDDVPSYFNQAIKAFSSDHGSTSTRVSLVADLTKASNIDCFTSFWTRLIVVSGSPSSSTKRLSRPSCDSTRLHRSPESSSIIVVRLFHDLNGMRYRIRRKMVELIATTETIGKEFFGG
jgi:hypothetical protein